MSGFREAAKQKQQADSDPTYGLMCSAHGCPMRWSVDPGRLCSYHAWSDSKHWPLITSRLQNEGAWALSRPREVDTRSHVGHPKAWALRLQERHQAGEKLSRIQIEMYREALRVGIVSEAA